MKNENVNVNEEKAFECIVRCLKESEKYGYFGVFDGDGDFFQITIKKKKIKKEN